MVAPDAVLSPSALNYNYNAGHSMFWGSAASNSYCTGGWTIYGTSGSFILTAGHCASVGSTVYGTVAAFGTVSYRKYSSSLGDSALVSYYNGVTPYQIVTGPVTGTHPGPNGAGRVTGIMPTADQILGVLVGKMGKSTGWTEGAVIGTYTYNGKTAILAAYNSGTGDSGGPVWRWDSYGLRALGMHVGSAYHPSTGARIGALYLPMNGLLTDWGAQMNVFSSASASASTSASASSANGVTANETVVTDETPPGMVSVGPGPEPDEVSPSLPNLCAEGCTIVLE
jgi:hypothetical protein